MQYRIKEVSKLIDVPIDTLRYYEKIGVISPNIDEKNHYRYYDAWDINFLLEYMYYRKMDYSTKEILKFIHQASLDEQIKFVKEKQEYYLEKYNYYDLLLKRNHRFIDSLEKINQELNSIQIISSNAYHYLAYRHNYQFNQRQELHNITSSWLKKYPFVDDLVLIPQEVILNQEANEYYWCFAIQSQYFQMMKLSKNEFVKTIPQQTCIRTIVDAKEQGMFHYNLLDHVMTFIKDHNFQLTGDPFGILLIRTHENGTLHRYIEFFIPIKY